MPSPLTSSVRPILTHENRGITEADAAYRLGLKVATLRAWRRQGRGPAFLRLGRAVRYLPADLDAFAASSRLVPHVVGRTKETNHR